MLVDDLQGTVHQVYSGLADPTYLIDADGRVAYVNMWTSASSLHQAIEALLAQGGRGLARGGWDRTPHLAAGMTDGWKGLRRGLPQSFVDLMIAAPGAATATWLGYQLRPLLAPLTLRSRPLPTPIRLALMLGTGIALILAVRRTRRPPARPLQRRRAPLPATQRWTFRSRSRLVPSASTTQRQRGSSPWRRQPPAPNPVLRRR